MNRVVLAGRLTKDPELRYTPNGNAVANFTIAINRPYRNQQGEQEADFINCVAWRNQAENLANYQKKGNLIGVDGKLQSRSYENQEGRRVFVTEVLAESITFLEPRNSSEQPTQRQAQEQFQPSGNTGQLNTMEQAGEPIDDSDLPF